MKQLSKKEILSYWKNTNNKTGVYIHSPFCKEQCNYCTYKGTLGSERQLVFNQYYKNYLPKLIEFYKDILKRDIIDNYFFGGGTPSLMSVEIMRNIFNIIPNFKNIDKKVFEFHMCDWTKKKLDILKEYNFNTVIACIQTFDSVTLKKQGRRVPKNINSILDFISYAKQLKFNIMSDIIYFNTGNIDKDINRLDSDITKLANIGITEISIQTLHDRDIGKFDTEVSNVIKKFLIKYPQYQLRNFNNYDNDNLFNQNGIKERKEIKLYLRNIEWYSMFPQDNHIDGILSGRGWSKYTNYNTLGIGSYNNFKYTFSKISDKIEYIENGNIKNPKWFITYIKKDNPTKNLIMEFYEKLESKVGDPPDGVMFGFETKVITGNQDNINKTVNRELITTVNWSDNSIIINNYIDKLKLNFPEWNWN